MDNITLKNELLKHISGNQDIESISYDLEYQLTPKNAIFLINESLSGGEKMRNAIDDLLTDINYHSFNRALEALLKAYDNLYK